MSEVFEFRSGWGDAFAAMAVDIDGAESVRVHVHGEPSLTRVFAAFSLIRDLLRQRGVIEKPVLFCSESLVEFCRTMLEESRIGSTTSKGTAIVTNIYYGACHFGGAKLFQEIDPCCPKD